MADNECGGQVRLEMEKFTRKSLAASDAGLAATEAAKKRRRNGLKCECAKESCVRCDQYKKCIVVMNANFKMINQMKAAKDGGVLDAAKRRTLRFDSAESSDSGVAALSNTDSSQSSGTSDITEPCSPPSPVSPPSCTSLPSDGDPLNGYDATSPTSYDSGLEETPASQPQSSVAEPSSSSGVDSSHSFRGSNGGCAVDVERCGRVQSSSVDCLVSSTTSHDEELPRSEAVSWSRSSPHHPPWLPTSTVPETTDLLCPAVGSSKIKSGCSGASQRTHRLPECDPLLLCRWTNCCQVVPGGGDMIDHIRAGHVDAQVNSESFVCLWEGCKVYGKASCSLSWLERHVLVHSGNKPFKCIVDGCGQRFTSQNGLERHVNSHFNQPHAHNGNLGKRKDESPSKMMKKKRLRFRRSCWTARSEDFFDTGIMECLRHRLVMLSDHTRLDIEGSSNAITFHSTVIARKVEVSGKSRVLLHWVPENIIPDEWVCESQVVSHLKQTIPLSSLPRDTLAGIESLSTPVNRPYRKNRRK